MKKIILLIITITLSSCYKISKVKPETYKYNNDIEFTITKIAEGNQIGAAHGAFYPKGDNKFVFVFLSIKNHSEIKQEVDFNNFYLIDVKNNIKYRPEWAMLTTFVNLMGNIKINIPKKGVKTRKLVFIYPKETKGEFLEVNNEICKINYK